MLVSRTLWPRRAVLSLFVAVVAATTTSAVQADPVTFASFQPNNLTPANPFKYDSAGTAGAGGLSKFVTNTTPLGGGGDMVPTAIDVDFNYLENNPFTAGLPAALLGVQAAKLTLDAQSEVGVAVFGGFAVQQHMRGSLEIRRTTPFLGQDLLLRVDFGVPANPNSGGRYQGTLRGQTSALAADEDLGETVIFTSDFIDFTGALSKNMISSFTSVNPRFLKDLVSQFYVSHTAQGAGTFSAQAVPEPGTIACALTGVAFAGVALIRRRMAKS